MRRPLPPSPRPDSPEVSPRMTRRAVLMGTAQLGTILLVGAMGSLATVLAAGPLVARVGTRRAMVAAAALFAFASLLLGVGPLQGLA